MLSSLKLSTGTLGVAAKIRVMPAGNDTVRSPVIFTRHLEEDGSTNGIATSDLKVGTCRWDVLLQEGPDADRLCCPPLK